MAGKDDLEPSSMARDPFEHEQAHESEVQTFERPSIAPGTGFTGEEADRIDMAFGLKSLGPDAPVPVPTKADDDRADEVRNEGNAEATRPPSDTIEAPHRPSQQEPTSTEFPDGEPKADEPVDDLGLSPSQGSELEHEGTISDPPEDARVFDPSDLGQLGEGDLMPAEVQEPGFPDTGDAQFDDPGFTLEPSSDFGAGDEVPADAIEGFDGGAVDEGF